MKNSLCSNGILDPSSDYGRATITEYVVLNVLGECTKEKLNAPYDLTSKEYGTINVKSSKICTLDENKFWEFHKREKEYIPDYYFCIGFSQYYHVIQHVWIIPGKAHEVKPKGIVVKKNEYGLNKFKMYEVDCNPYNKAFREFDNSLYSEFCNIERKEFKYKQLDYVKPDPNKLNYEEFLRYLEEHEFETYSFNPENGIINMFPSIWTIPYSDKLYPIFGYDGAYLGFMMNERFIKITPINKETIAMEMRIRDLIKSTTEYDITITFEYLFDKFPITELPNYLNKLCDDKIIKRVGDYEYVYIGITGEPI